MDFDKFYVWKQHAALSELSDKGSVVPETCLVVYERLVDAGYASAQEGGACQITDAGREAAPRSKREAKRLLNELISENHKLVRRLVSQLFKRSMSFSEEEDLYQSGLMALVKTLERFDPARFSKKGLGHSFATYLRHWVRDHVQKDTQRQQPIRHPKGFGMPYSVFKKAEEILSRTGKIATAEQLGSYKVKGRSYRITEELLNKWRSAQNSVVSMDAGGEDGVPHDMPDSSKSPESLLDRAQRTNLVDTIISELSANERKVLEMMREGGASNRKLAGVLGCKDEAARLFRLALMEKLKKRMGWRE